jgi:hypothetical protein
LQFSTKHPTPAVPFPQVWPQLGLLHASAAKLAHLLERPSEAAEAAQAAARILASTHGEGGAVVAEMRRVEREARLEMQQQRQQQQQLGSDSDD